MAYKLEWDKPEEKLYEIGCDHGVLYPMSEGTYPKGVVWNGLISVTNNPSGGESTKLYADNIPYLTLRSAEEFGFTIECYMYPDEFKECDGSVELQTGISVGQQTRKSFGVSYRTKVGNSTEKEDFGYKIHVIYGATVSPSEKGYQTINDSPDAITFSYEATSDPVNIPNAKPASEIIFDSTKVDKEVMEAIEKVLYGDSDGDDARLPMPEDLLSVAESAKASLSLA